jgi:hypothetical protein
MSFLSPDHGDGRKKIMSSRNLVDYVCKHIRKLGIRDLAKSAHKCPKIPGIKIYKTPKAFVHLNPGMTIAEFKMKEQKISNKS